MDDDDFVTYNELVGLEYKNSYKVCHLMDNGELSPTYLTKPWLLPDLDLTSYRQHFWYLLMVMNWLFDSNKKGITKEDRIDKMSVLEKMMMENKHVITQLFDAEDIIFMIDAKFIPDFVGFHGWPLSEFFVHWDKTAYDFFDIVQLLGDKDVKRLYRQHKWNELRDNERNQAVVVQNGKKGDPN